MKPYIDTGSGVVGYENGRDYIQVWFRKGSCYLYTYDLIGSQIVEDMKLLAVKGDGLQSYINKHRDRLHRAIKIQ